MAAEKSKPSKSVKFVLMEKDGMQLEVHPTTVKSHELVGWKVVEKPQSKKPDEMTEETVGPSESEQPEE